MKPGKKIEKINETNNLFFEKINHMDRISWKKREDSNKIINQRGNITTDTREIERVRGSSSDLGESVQMRK